MAGNINPTRPAYNYTPQQLRRHTRKSHRAPPAKGGIRRRAQAGHIVRSFCLNDTVLHQKQRWFVRAMRVKGSFILKRLDGSKVEITPSKIVFLWHNNSYLVEKREIALCSYLCR